jgi:hypothetical protein
LTLSISSSWPGTRAEEVDLLGLEQLEARLVAQNVARGRRPGARAQELGVLGLEQLEARVVAQRPRSPAA